MTASDMGKKSAANRKKKLGPKGESEHFRKLREMRKDAKPKEAKVSNT